MNDAMGFTREDMAQEEREFFKEHDAKVRADVIDKAIELLKTYPTVKAMGEILKLKEQG